ncbi:MAG TPA: hypothetical protein VN634_19420 [Candidatus Limnocylindrales bacterium]|nr:hypothetical protein [Candidatus Limnocylindrales bacterium]
MIRKVLRRTTGMFLLTLAVLAVALPQAAVASDRDETLELADTIRDLGYSGEAAQIEQLVAGMSDSELQLLGDAGFFQISSKLKAYQVAKERADALEFISVEPQGASQRAILSDYDLSTFPAAVYPPQDSTCVNAVGTVSTAAVKVGLKATVFTLREALTAADGAQRAAMAGCNIIVIAIGIGGNAASACVVSAIVLSVADAALSVGEIFIDNLIFCDEQVHFAESEASAVRAEYLSHQLELHDLELGEQIATHDVEVQAKVQQAIARAASIEGKIDLGLKTQLEVAMDRKTVTRPSIFYEDRLDELCDLAQEAIDDLPATYILATRAQTLVNDGMAFKITDPKRAADECIRGFSMATTKSTEHN